MAMCGRAAMRLLARGPQRVTAASAVVARPAARAPLPHSPAGTPRARQVSTEATAFQQGELGQAPPYVPYAGPPPVFVGFSVYKKQGALAVKPVKPRWALTSGGAHQIESPGCLLFELAPAAPGSGTGPGERRYAWDAKVQVAMSPLELAKIMREPHGEHSFYHDSYKGQPGREGTLTKSLKWSMAPDGNAYFINASSTEQGPGPDKKVTKQASVSVSPDELYVLQQLVNGCMPYMYGFDAAFLYNQGP